MIRSRGGSRRQQVKPPSVPVEWFLFVRWYLARLGSCSFQAGKFLNHLRKPIVARARRLIRRSTYECLAFNRTGVSGIGYILIDSDPRFPNTVNCNPQMR